MGEITVIFVYVIFNTPTFTYLLFLIGSCDGYQNITDPWRNLLFKSSSFSGYPHDDVELVNKWWRFTGIGGDRVINTCNTGTAGGAQYSAHVSFAYPTTESGTSSGTAYADVGACNYYSFTMNVVLCPGGFYIYKPDSHPYSNMGYVTCKK